MKGGGGPASKVQRTDHDDPPRRVNMHDKLVQLALEQFRSPPVHSPEKLVSAYHVQLLIEHALQVKTVKALKDIQDKLQESKCQMQTLVTNVRKGTGYLKKVVGERERSEKQLADKAKADE